MNTPDNLYRYETGGIFNVKRISNQSIKK